MLAFAAPALGWNVLDYGPEGDEPSADSAQPNELPFEMRVDVVPNCGECAHFRAGAGQLGRCGLRDFLVAPDTRCCDSFDAP